jgi:hypothetical protein
VTLAIAMLPLALLAAPADGQTGCPGATTIAGDSGDDVLGHRLAPLATTGQCG